MNEGAIKAAIARQVGKLGSYEAAAELLGGIRKSQLHRMASLSEDAHIGLKLAAELDALTGSPELIRLAAAFLGYRLVPLAARESVDDALAAVCDLVAKAGALAPSVRQAAADHVFSPNEKRSLHCDIAEVQASLAALAMSIGGADE